MPVDQRGNISELSLPDLGAIARCKAVDDELKTYRRIAKAYRDAKNELQRAAAAVPRAEEADSKALEKAVRDDTGAPRLTAPDARRALEEARVREDATGRVLVDSERVLLAVLEDNIDTYMDAATARQAHSAEKIRDAVQTLEEAINQARDNTALVAWLRNPGKRPMAKLRGRGNYVAGVTAPNQGPHLTATILAGLRALAQELDVQPAVEVAA